MSVLVDTANTPSAWTRRALSIEEPWAACGWSRDGQEARFDEIWTALEPQPGERLLDYGCGTGEFAEWCCGAHIIESGRTHYLGFDWSLGMIARARDEHPTAEFTTMLRDGETWDLVVACGTFNLPDNWSKGHTFPALMPLWARCKRALAVSLYAGDDEACLRYTPGDAATMGAALLRCGGGLRFSVNRGYLPNDLLLVVER